MENLIEWEPNSFLIKSECQFNGILLRQCLALWWACRELLILGTDDYYFAIGKMKSA